MCLKSSLPTHLHLSMHAQFKDDHRLLEYVSQATAFTGNTARQYGSAIVTTDYVTLAIMGSTFTSNGDVAGISPPSAGGAISIGYNQFVVGTPSQSLN